jgi:transposase
MELLSVIRRWHYRGHFSIREISRRTGLSRNTVRKAVTLRALQESCVRCTFYDTLTCNKE